MTSPARRVLPVPYFGGAHDGDAFRASLERKLPQRIARSHSQGAGCRRSVYFLTRCECHGIHYRYAFEEALR